MSVPLTVLVITRDEEAEIADCLASVAWADERMVVDSGSRDRTVELAEAAGARVLTHDFVTHGRQRNWAMERAAHRWILVLDADERAGPGLAEEIAALLEGEPSAAAYRLRRRNWLLGGWVRHGSWAKDRVVRLLDRERCRYDDRRIHERVLVDGETGDLRSPLLHYTCRDLGEFLERGRAYARLGAADARERGRRARWWDLALRPTIRFLRSYLLLWGFLDGRRGLAQAGMTAYAAWMKYLHLLDMEIRDRQEGGGKRGAGR